MTSKKLIGNRPTNLIRTSGKIDIEENLIEKLRRIALGRGVASNLKATSVP
jgi:hypothetical protein